jgi:hypothetical protein
MQISNEVKAELNALSKEIFGSTSKWRKMMELGVPEVVTEDTTKLKIVEGKEEKETVKTTVMHVGPNGGELPLNRLKRYTVDEVRSFMLEVKEKQEQIRAMIKRIEEQKKAQENHRQAVAEAVTGSSV